MALDQGYFRRLYEGLSDHDDDDRARRSYLRGRRRTAADHLAALRPLGKRERPPANRHAVADDQQWRIAQLYALSRVSDLLVERCCPEGEPPTGFGVTGGRRVAEGGVTSRSRFDGAPGRIASRRLAPDALATLLEFHAGIGLTPFEHAAAFSPFHHEVFAVVQDASSPTVTVAEVLWPGFWFGDLLFSRAGVRVRAPRHLIDATVATTSTLYFTFRRHPRPANDPSHGWGANSQWRTRFHRFYSDDEGLHFNWDGTVDIGEDPPTPSRHDEDPLDQRRELLLHRSFVRGPLPRDEDDRYPYGDRMSLAAADWPLRLVAPVPPIR